jgi:hypothetical protein
MRLAHYKVRKAPAGAGTLNVPPHVMKLIPEEARFELEINDDGLLYRLVQDIPTEQIPPWAKAPNPQVHP